MTQALELQLARISDAKPIALMSRNLIESGLGWSWTQPRIAAAIRCRDTNVVIARGQRCIAGFAIMRYGLENAHLNLFAVAQSFRRRGIGMRLLRWVENSAETAGMASISLETRADNRVARAFYRSAGFEEVMLIPGYYRGRESAVRMARFLRMNEQLAGLFAACVDSAPGEV